MKKCRYCGTLNEDDAKECSRCGRELAKKSFRLGMKAKLSLLFLIFAMVYLASPIDILPLSFFDDIVVVLVAVAIWVIAVIIEGKGGE